MTHQVSPEYLEYLESKQNGRTRWSPWKFWRARHTPVPANPFGTGKGYKFEDMYDTLDNNKYRRRTGPFPKYDLPIQGPPNWDQLWTDQSMVGNDYRLWKAWGKPLPNKQLRYLREERPGELWRNIEFVRQLGFGSFGVVWEVSAQHKMGPGVSVQRRTAKTVKSVMVWGNWDTVQLACKVVRFDSSKHNLVTVVVDSMLSDMHQLRYLKHDNIVQFVDIIGVPDSQTGFPYSSVLMLMDKCDGDLDELIEKSGQLSQQQTIEWLRQISLAVRYLHMDVCTVHLDIKPSNILYSTNGGQPVDQWQYKLGDFGMAITYPDRQSMHSQIRCGTRIYMAPEMDNGGGRFMLWTTPCDIYSLGATVANSLLGKQYRKDTFRYELAKLSGIHTHLLSLVKLMTYSHPNQRSDIKAVCNIVFH